MVSACTSKKSVFFLFCFVLFFLKKQHSFIRFIVLFTFKTTGNF